MTLDPFCLHPPPSPLSVFTVAELNFFFSACTESQQRGLTLGPAGEAGKAPAFPPASSCSAAVFK